MKACGVDLAELRDSLRAYLDKELEALRVEGEQDPSPTSGFQRIVQRAILHVQSSGRDEVNGANVLVAMFSERETYAVYFLQQQDMSRLDAVSYISHQRSKDIVADDPAPSTPARRTLAKRTRKNKIYISYAWGDSTEAGRKREAVVNQICELAEKRGIDVRRDKTTLRPGDSISSFMKRIGRGDRIFVILSQRYLESTYCMFELSEIWRNAKLDRKVFLNRVRIFALEDANIFKPKDWVHWALHWKTEHDDLDGLARQHGASLLGSVGHKHLVQMQHFYMHIPDILGNIADIVVPKSVEDLEQYGLDDLID
jgi:hypothetical protein